MKHILINERIFLDVDRQQRTLIPEVIFAASKSEEDLYLALEGSAREAGAVFASRLTLSQQRFLEESSLEVQIDSEASTASLGQLNLGLRGSVALVAAGTSDFKILKEARNFLDFLKIHNETFCDVGVASLGRLLHFLPEVNKADVLIVFAGMEGALPSVLAGLTPKPLIAVPTSIGYGVSEGGHAALNSILSSCSPGVIAVNIDNGIGAAAAAVRILGIKDKTNV